MASISDLYQSPWLKAEDLRGAARRVRIAGVTVQEFKNQDGAKERKAVVSFVDKDKKLICNKSQAMSFIKLFGDDTDGWHGREVYLAPTPTPSGKESISISGVPVAEDAGEKIPF